MQVSWSESMSRFVCKERLFEKIIKAAEDNERDSLKRELLKEQMLKEIKREDKNAKSNISVGPAPSPTKTKRSISHHAISVANASPTRQNTDRTLNTSNGQQKYQETKNT